MFSSFSLVQLLTPLFCLVMVLRAVSRFRRREQTIRELLVWLVVWVGIASVSVYPSVSDVMPAFIGIKSGVNVLIYFGMVVLFYGLFRLVVKVEELEYRISEMNRKIALGEDLDSKK